MYVKVIGTPLFAIDRAPFEVALAQAKGVLAQATAQAESTKREETRLAPLVSERAVSRKEFDDATSARQLAEASLQQARAAVQQAELNLSYTSVAAPVGGITGRAARSVGALITTDANGSLLTTINQLRPSGSPQPGGVGPGQGARRAHHARHAGGGDAGARRRHAVPAERPPQLRRVRHRRATGHAAASRGVRQPQGAAPPGQFVKVSIGAGQRDGVFLVPQAAVIQTEKTYLVFVLDAQGKARQSRPVVTGDWVGSDWSIVSGLKAGDRVIVDNLQKIRPGAPVTVAPPQAAPAPAASTK